MSTHSICFGGEVLLMSTHDMFYWRDASNEYHNMIWWRGAPDEYK